MLVDSHVLAVEEGRAERIQAIDMGRRGLHNEGATLMVERLDGKISHRFRDRAAAVHAGLRTSSKDLTCREGPDLKIDGTPYRCIWLEPSDGWSVRIIDQTKLPWSLDFHAPDVAWRRPRMRSARCRCGARR